jgi:hypothetical protein
LRFSELLDVAFDEVEVYDNQTQVIGKTFLLPFADGGLALYNYYVIDSVKVADTSIAIDSSKFIYKNKTLYFDKVKYDTSIVKNSIPDSISNNVLTQ